MSVIDTKHGALLVGGLNLGPPVGPEIELPDGGRKRRYQAGTIYQPPRQEEAFELHGLILQTYLQMGESVSGLGYPLSDEGDAPTIAGGRVNRFQNGTLTYSQEQGVVVAFEPVPAEDLATVVVKISDAVPLPFVPGNRVTAEELCAAAGLPLGIPLLDLLQSALRGMPFRLHFEAIDPDTLAAIVARAQAKNPAYVPPRFYNYFSVRCVVGQDPQEIVDLFKQLPGIVEHAYIEPRTVDAVVVGTANPDFPQLNYLKAAPVGIGVQAAWMRGADGSNTKFIDVEQGWLLTHEDLPQGIPLLFGTNKPSSFYHGVAVLGLIVGVDDLPAGAVQPRGGVGISPKATAAVMSHFTPAKTQRMPIASLALLSFMRLSDGDVLLMEVQGALEDDRLVPREFSRETFDAVRLITTAGVVVVAGAGNGNLDLDELTDGDGRHIFSKAHPAEFRDSGAILVGSCRAPVPHSRPLSSTPTQHSNFGSRVDCCAQGELIRAPSADETKPFINSLYTSTFGGTSAASAIITGVCLLIQDMQQRLTPRSIHGKLNPAQMRDLLRNPANGTPTMLVSDRIGQIPDMAKIVANYWL